MFGTYMVSYIRIGDAKSSHVQVDANNAEEAEQKVKDMFPGEPMLTMAMGPQFPVTL